MRRSNKFANPFYGLLLAAGIAFALTATSYVVMAFRDRDIGSTTHDTTAAALEHPLMTWMSRHGEMALVTELALLAVATVGAIATDSYWQSREAANRNRVAASSRNS